MMHVLGRNDNSHMKNTKSGYIFFAFNSRCNCEVGYTGVNCESHYVPCEPSPCQNGGTCIPQDLLNYKCQCPKGKLIDLLSSLVGIANSHHPSSVIIVHHYHYHHQ